jgi:DedD protein
MVVLVGAGVLGFPWLFETQPRPMSPDVRIVQAGAAAQVDSDASPRTSAGRVVQAERPAPQVVSITPPAEPTPPPVASDPPAAQAAKPQPVAPSAPKVKLAETSRPAEKLTEKPAEKTVDKKPVDKKPEAKADAKASDTRYVVQFGAFADVNAAREARQKAERLGLRTYAQQVDTPQGKRVRVRLGPFADKAEADKALATLRKGGLNGNILTL